jgi:hypothetical protein
MSTQYETSLVAMQEWGGPALVSRKAPDYTD